MSQHPDETAAADPTAADLTADETADEARDDERVETRSELLPEEQVAGSDNPHDQAEAILAESDERVAAHADDPADPDTPTPA